MNPTGIRPAREALIEAAHRLVESQHVRSMSAVPDAIEALSQALDRYRETVLAAEPNGGRCRFEYPGGKCDESDGHAGDCMVDDKPRRRSDAYDDRPASRRRDLSRTADGVADAILRRTEKRCNEAHIHREPRDPYVGHMALAIAEIIVEEREEAIRRATER